MPNPKNIHTFNIDFTNEDDNERLQGVFTVKRLSVMDFGAVGVKKAQLSGGMYCVKDENGNPTGQGIDEETDWINGMIAHLSVCIVQKPVWFKLEEISNLKLVRAVYAEVAKFEASFKSRQPTADNGSDGVRSQDSGTQHTQTVTGNTPTAVVGQKVSAALDA